MYWKKQWINRLAPAAVLLLVSAWPVAAQKNEFPVMRFAFIEGDTARDMFVEGTKLLDQGQYTKAVDVFRKVLERYPRNPIADKNSYYLIHTLENMGKVSDALAQIAVFEKSYPRSDWLNDVRQIQVRLTKDSAMWTPPPSTPQAAPVAVRPPVPPQTPAPPAPAAGIRGPFVRTGKNTAEENPEIMLQQEAFRVLFENNADRAIELATDRLKADPSDPVVLSNLHMVAGSKSDKALPMLVTLAKTSPEMKARREAVLWISRSRGEKDALTDVLVSLVPSMTGDEDSAAIAFALSQVNTPKAFDALATMARDKNKPERLRMEAVRTIGDSRLPNRVTMLDDIYKGSMDNVKMRRQVAMYLSHAKEPQAVTALANIASTDPDQNVKITAVNYLGQIKTPEAQKALEDLLMKKKP